MFHPTTMSAIPPEEDRTKLHAGSENLPDWVDGVMGSWKLSSDASVEETFEKADTVATRLAPNTRRMWGSILVIQGLAVLVPLFWLLVLRNRWNVSYTASMVMICTLLLVGILWWVRWRGMQHTWVRSRMVAEIARSLKVTRGFAPKATVSALSTSPALRAIAIRISPEEDIPSPSWRESSAQYREDRIRDQLRHYHSKLAEAQKERRNLSRTVTLCLDAALFLAVLGVAISVRDRSASWLAWTGSDYILGFIGASLPLTALLAQLRGSYLELNRRNGCYMQQIEFLAAADQRTDTLSSEAEFQQFVADVERALLGEVVDWFYQAESREQFYRPARSKKKRYAASSVRPAGIPDRLLATLGISLGFVGRVLIGRMLVVALSIVFTTALIHYKQAPQNPATLARLSTLEGQLLMPAKFDAESKPLPYELWNPDEFASDRGLIVIAHGLTDGVQDPGTEPDHWMTRMQRSLASRLGEGRPGICLVNWHDSAKPGEDSDLRMEGGILDLVAPMPSKARAMMRNVSMIRPQGERIGELVGFKLARAIRQGLIDKDAPMHLIGHSAGGFVVLHAAIVLNELELAPANLRVTMLDTPLPVRADIEKIAGKYPVDFYRTSDFAQGVPATGFVQHFTSFDVAPPEGYDRYLRAHSFAYEWFVDSISNGDPLGFVRSPFVSVPESSE